MTSSANRLGSTGFPFRVYYAAMLALLYLPLLVLFVFSFSPSAAFVFPPRGLTLDWYGGLLDAPGILNSARNSLVVGLVAASGSTVLATMVALLALRYRFPGRQLILAAAVLPLIVPFVVLAAALLVLFRALDFELGLGTIAAGHIVVAMPFALLIIASRLNGLDPRLEDAAMDLGATYPSTIMRVVVPLLAPALLSAWMTAFTVSFDEFAIALFLAGTEPTFPVYLVSQLRFASRLPVLIAMAVLMMAGTLALVVAAERIRRRRA